MDQVPIEININDFWHSKIHSLLISLDLTNPAFCYISAETVRSFSHGAVSMMYGTFAFYRPYFNQEFIPLG